ncbi:hypothetical protein GCM10009133_26850 [Cocleimonas flava]|uniref:Uncharacterized protein n=1 Tax=Cocleimonas flava TaxID=634765 RepID=A0A4R1EYV4_9GAMM|nr:MULTISPECIES: hypothetical protein [Cocleimonas]MEB8432795.1 hypothetical protein [Cocleimonas sp. KMM 6892]MEC4715654.1 hypothetical protein [Cocleimonas sp. KMM 6895]MEC4744728.1 hypothetical protein [Cocleimonas sp. KMM 6896]TCJ83221.1 hypothetical protein EV695_3961 [Cocleimonas flava]
MSFEISVEIAEQIAMFALYADMSTNLDLKRRIIDSKKEYIESFNKRFAGFIDGPLSSSLSAERMVIPHNKKKKSGCDTTIIISSKGVSKIAISKYKYPSFQDPQMYWDRHKKRSEKSLFSSQLDKQQKYSDEYAVMEKFINNKIINQTQAMTKDTANCIWHADVMSFNQSCRQHPESLWNTQHLLDLFDEKNPSDIGSMLKAVCLDPIAVPVSIPSGKIGIKNYIRENKLPSRVLSINVID